MAIGGQGTYVSLPIGLEVLQSSVTNLENVLKNLKPDSKAFRELERVLKSARAEMDRLQVQASKPFGNQQQFNQTEKTIDKIGEALSRAQLTIDRIDFKDLKLTDDQQKTFDAFEQQLKDIKQGVVDFKNTMKGDLLADVNFKSLLESLDPQYASKSFDEIVKIIEEKSQALNNALQHSNEKIRRAQAEAQNALNIKAMQETARTHGGKDDMAAKAQAVLGGNVFEKFFTVDKNELLKFKSGGQEQFIQYLEETYNLSPQQIDKLQRTIGATRVLETIFATDKNQFFTEQLESGARANKRVREEKVNNEDLKAQADNLTPALENLREKTAAINAENDAAAGKTDAVTAAIQQYVAIIVAAVRQQSGYEASLKTGNTELDSFRTTLAQTNSEFLRLQNQRRVFDSIKTGITNFMGFNQVLNLTKRAISEAANHIKSLDTVMNGIAIVTDMTTADLWNQVDAYSKVAQTYGTSIQGAYEVSKIYYQAGYDTADVMTLMNETLKLSKISGLDYATTTDYMMTAMRGFKLEMEDASRVVDVYSNLAAHTAVSQQELAEAMTRTASSMESVGSTFEETSSMIATMVAVTRESASNIGSAMKSIASRYGELTKNPAGFQDLEGEEYSFNKVDQALQSVGISMKDTNGQFRSFTEVILELTDVWNDLTSVQQRYIATQMAGNRQQSRFLALVSNGDLLRENLENALNSEDVGTLQALEYLDSLEAKIEQVQVAYQQFYTTIGVQDAWKSTLGWIRNIIDNLNNLPKVFGKLPVSAGIAIANLISVIKNLLLSGLASFSQNWSQLMKEMEQTGETGGVKTGNKFIDQIVSIIRSRREEVQAATQEALKPDEGKVAEAAGEAADKADKKTTSFWSNFGNKNDALTRGISTLASSLVGLSMAFDQSTDSGRKWSGALMGVGGALQTSIGIIRVAHGDLTAIPQLISGISSIASAIGIWEETTEEKIERLTKEAENLSNIAKQAKADERNLSNSIAKVRELEKTRYDSAEAAEEYQAAVEELADAFPNLIVGFDNLGNAVVDVTEITDGGSVAENELAAARKRTAEATYKAAQAETNAAETRLAEAQEKLNNFSVGTAVFNNDSYEDYLSSNTVLSALYIAGYTDRFGYKPQALEPGARMTNFVASWKNGGLSDILKTVAGGELNERIDKLFESSNSWEELYQAINKWSDESNDAVDRVKQFVNKTQEVVAGPLESYESISKLYILLKQNAFDPLIADQYEIYKKAVEEYADLELRDSDAAKSIGSIIDFNELKSLVEDVVGADAEYVLSYREQIIGWLQTHSFSSDSVITNVLYKQFEEAKNGNNNIKFEDWIKEQTETVKIYQEWLNGLDPKHSNALNSIIRDNLSKYSFDQIVDTLSLTQGDGIYEIFEEYYGSRIVYIQTLLNNKISEVLKDDDTALAEFQDYVTNSGNDLSANRQNLINDILERYTKLSDINKTLSESYLDAMLSLLRDVDNEEISSEVANVIFSGDLFSKDGINNIIAELGKQELSTDELVERLKGIRDSFIENYTLSLTAAASELADSWSDTSKKLSSLRSGIDFVEMQKIIAASDLTENDFYTEDGKNYILNLEKYREYVTKYFEDIKNANNYFEDEEFNAIASLSRNALKDEQKTMLSQIGFDINGEGYWEDDGSLSQIGSSALNQAINNHKKARDAFNSALDYATQASINEVEWLAGQYDIGKDALKYGAYKGNNASYKSQISKAHEALNKLITDVVANGLENINFTDYENIGIHHDILSDIQWDIINGISTEEFVRKYAIYLGKTASETASLLIKVMDQQDSASKLVQGITGLKVNSRTDFTSILEAAQKQAGGEDLYNQLATSLKNYGATLHDGILDVSQTADIPSIISLIVEFAQQIGLNLEGFMGSFRDAMENGVKDTANLIKSGIKGTLSYANAEKLANDSGINLTFTKTAEGLKLSTEQAYKLYQQLKEVNSLQADLIFEELVKSLTQDIGNEYSNISKVTAEIAELNRQIAQGDAKDVEQLKQRLTYLEKIRSTMLNTPEQFNFMDRSLSEGLSGPINYWNAAGKAKAAMIEATKTGYIGIQDYTNIVNELTNMAKMTGNSMTFLGHTIEADGTGSAELIKAGYEAISNVDGKGAKISLKRMGDEFKVGADGLVDGFEEGLKAMAEEQIKVLDAEIAMLEAIVALEDLDLDENGNGAFELTDWFETTGEAANTAKKEFRESANSILELAKSNESLNKSLTNATFSYTDENGETLTTNLSNALQLVASGAVLGEDFANNFTTAFATYVFSNLGADWNLNTIQPDAESLMNGEEVDHTIDTKLEYDESTPDGLQDLIEGQNLDRTVTVKVLPIEQIQAAYDSENAELEKRAQGMNLGAGETEDGPKKTELTVQFSEATPEPIQEIVLTDGPVERDLEIHVRADGDTELLETLDNEAGKSPLNDIHPIVTGLNKKGAENYKSDSAGGRDPQVVEALRQQDLYEMSLIGQSPENSRIDFEKKQKEIGLRQLGTSEELIDILLNDNTDYIPNDLLNAFTAQFTDLTKNAGDTLEVRDIIGQYMTKLNSYIPDYFTSSMIDDIYNAAAQNAVDNYMTKDAKYQKLAAYYAGQLADPYNAGLVNEDENSLFSYVGGKKSLEDSLRSIGTTDELINLLLNSTISGNEDEFSQTLKKQFIAAAQGASNSEEASTAMTQFWEKFSSITMDNSISPFPPEFVFATLDEAIKEYENGLEINGDTEVTTNGDVNVLGTITPSDQTLTYEPEVADQPPRPDYLPSSDEVKNIEETTEATLANFNAYVKPMQVTAAHIKTTASFMAATAADSEDYSGAITQGTNALNDATEYGKELANETEDIKTDVEESKDAATILLELLENGQEISYDDLVRAFQSICKNAYDANEAFASINAFIEKNPAIMNYFANKNQGFIVYDAAETAVNSRAKGNVALSRGRNTLMGELGPELYVANGRYYVAGQNGAEFVDLPDDAIVFNHIQTKRLLSGFTGGHGKPVTNEYKAISYATGNVTGPAQASAQAALEELKRIRALWDAMLNADLKSLAQQAGSGGGGGGGDKNNKANAAFIADLERWYNLLRQIAKLEKDINYEEALRSKIQSDRIGNGKAIYASLKREIEALDDEIARNKELSYLQKDYYDRRREDLASSNFGKIFTFNENGLMQYNDQAIMANGDRGGLFALAELNQQNPDGSTKYTAKEQYELLKAWGFAEEMRYDNQGKEIVYDKKSENADDYYTKAVQAFWDKADGWKDELDSLYDSYNEQLTNVIQNEDKRNKLLQEIIDNQLSLEQKVLKAIEDREQTLIDNLQAERDALQEAADKYVEGLNKQLENERKMYENQEQDTELNKLRRQLAILQRSGGSASQIASLQQQINEKERTAYFDTQQEQIDAIKEASDLEIERLDAQLDLMKETLEYAKKNGLLWAEVADVMSQSKEFITEFITGNTIEWANKSPLAKSEDLNDLLMEIEQWIEAREDKENPIAAEGTHNWDNYVESAQKRYSKVWTDDNVAKAKAAFDEEYAKSSDPNRAGAAADAVFAKQLEEYYARHPEEDPRKKTVTSNGTSGTAGSGSGNTSGTSTKQEQGTLIINHYNEQGKCYKQEKKLVYVGKIVYAREYVDTSKQGYLYCYKASPAKLIMPAGTATINLYYKVNTNTNLSKQAETNVKETRTGARISAFAGGGLADYTGLAMLHGTKTRPEAVLNAEETKMWRDQIMSSKPTSLMSLLIDFRDMIAGSTNKNIYNSINRGGEAYTFENVSVNMNVASIANDYDARRAGQTALDEMLNIARKTSAQNVRR